MSYTNKSEQLISANKELVFQNEEKEKRAAELIIANIELAFQNEEKEKRANELDFACKELKKTEEYLTEYVKALEEMMFITSHKVRQPVANILGITNIIRTLVNSPAKLRKMVGYLEQSAVSLDKFINELTEFISNLDKKNK